MELIGRAVRVVACALGLTGCSLITDLGDLEGDAGSSDAPASDAVSDIAIDTSSCAPAGACVATLPPGWTLLTTDAPCPSSFTMATLTKNPTASPGRSG